MIFFFPGKRGKRVEIAVSLLILLYMSLVTISYCLDRDSGAIASIEPSVSLLHIWIAEMGNVGEEEVAVSCRKDSGVKHDLLKCFKSRYKQYVFLFSLFMLLL